MLFNLEQIKNYLPHRDPFLFIDRVESIILKNESGEEIPFVPTTKELVGTTVTAYYETKESHPVFVGHFPGNPIFPGVVQIELMAQAASFGVVKLFKNPHEAKILEVAFMGVDAVRFRKPIKPSMLLQIKATCTRARGAIMSYTCSLSHEGSEIASAEILAQVKV